MAPGVDSASNRNEYQVCFLECKDGRYVGLTTLPLLCADCLENWEPQPLGTLRACNRIALKQPKLLLMCFSVLLSELQYPHPHLLLRQP
jgi:hypothetical protein